VVLKVCEKKELGNSFSCGVDGGSDALTIYRALESLQWKGRNDRVNRMTIEATYKKSEEKFFAFFL